MTSINQTVREGIEEVENWRVDENGNLQNRRTNHNSRQYSSIKSNLKKVFGTFTLFEWLIVFMIMFMLFLLTFPMIRDFLENRVNQYEVEIQLFQENEDTLRLHGITLDKDTFYRYGSEISTKKVQEIVNVK